jgi:hypothetical protein
MKERKYRSEIIGMVRVGMRNQHQIDVPYFEALRKKIFQKVISRVDNYSK